MRLLCSALNLRIERTCNKNLHFKRKISDFGFYRCVLQDTCRYFFYLNYLILYQTEKNDLTSVDLLQYLLCYPKGYQFKLYSMCHIRISKDKGDLKKLI